MSDYYRDIYSKRLNRYGYDYQTRVQNQREREFENKLLKSVYRVEFEYEGGFHPATLEKYQQNETRILQYLLTRVSLKMPNGTILMIPNKDNESQYWMVYWLETIQASGYNKYILLKMTHYISWKDENGQTFESWCYLHGAGDSVLRDSLKEYGAIYLENNKENFIVMPVCEHLKKETYFEIGEGALKENYRVVGYDIQSVPGVEYVTIDPTYEHDTSKISEEDADGYYWLTGGTK